MCLIRVLQNGQYVLEGEGNKAFSSEGFADYLAGLVSQLSNYLD
ncbi:MAG: hypothetical protein U1E91_03335 [Moraxella sp.]